ncbi:hypothetical protein Cni_G23881 [Canna indica]|uniref:Uncharacterized protein n=1 Tax=Canna indica TaxID=4628 RepID=A0AAQ3KUY0_9LILI|nr:hypothetical protein Cni_G23881 [Canna indica]
METKNVVTTFLAFLFLVFSSRAATSDATSIEELLRNHGLPGGLLPKAVESYTHNASSGLLEVRLKRPCYALYEDGLAYFESEVRGNLSYGALRGVVGWSQEELFLWLPVKGILVADPASGVILFDIGVARKRLAISAFEEPPDCHPDAAAGVGELGIPKKKLPLVGGVSHLNGCLYFDSFDFLCVSSGKCLCLLFAASLLGIGCCSATNYEPMNILFYTT